jgi:hypothetical protein
MFSMGKQSTCSAHPLRMHGVWLSGCQRWVRSRQLWRSSEPRGWRCATVTPNVGVGAVGRPWLPSLATAAAALSSVEVRGGRLLSCGARSTTRR